MIKEKKVKHLVWSLVFVTLGLLQTTAVLADDIGHGRCSTDPVSTLPETTAEMVCTTNADSLWKKLFELFEPLDPETEE